MEGRLELVVPIDDVVAPASCAKSPSRSWRDWRDRMKKGTPERRAPVAPSVVVEAGATGNRPVSEKTAWRVVVEKRRRELHDDYPCAAPTARTICPKHRTRVGPITRICKRCRDELY